MKGDFGDLCYRTECSRPALARHQSNGKYYCEFCAQQLNTIHRHEAQRLHNGPLLHFPDDYTGRIFLDSGETMDDIFTAPPQGVIRSAALVPEKTPQNSAVPHAAEWVAYHTAYPEVYAEFCRLAEQMRMERQRAYYSIEVIINVMRWHRDLGPQHGNEQFRINNNFKSFYGRAYEYHYAAESFFRRRKSYADLITFPPAHYGILRGRLPAALLSVWQDPL